MHVNPVFSVIIPVYNTEKYLCRSIESVISQTFLNFELIIIDDGSTDGSRNIIKQYADRDNRIKAVYKENGGVSSARNAGLNIASGDWVVFLDSDDWLEADTLEKIKELTDNNDLDAVMFEFSIDYSDGKSFVHRYDDSKRAYGKIDNDKLIWSCLNESYFWTKAYSRRLIGSIRFSEDIYRGEDTKFSIEVLYKAQRIMSTDKALYHYVQSENSATRGGITERQLTGLIYSEWLMRFITDYYPQFVKIAQDIYVNMRVNFYYLMYYSQSDVRSEKRLEEMYSEAHKYMRRVLSDSSLSKKKRLKFFLFDKSPKLYCRLLRVAVRLMPGQKYAMYK